MRGRIGGCTRYLRGNIRVHISEQDTFRSIQRRTGVSLQQKIHFGEHEKHENNEKTRKISGLWMFFMKALYIGLFRYRLRL